GITIPGASVGVANTKSGFGRWLQSWMLREEDKGVWWWPQGFDQVPERAFASPEERETLARLHHAACTGNPVDPVEVDRTFGAAADRRFAERPFECGVGLPLARSVLLWGDMPQIRHAQMTYMAHLTIAAFRS